MDMRLAGCSEVLGCHAAGKPPRNKIFRRRALQYCPTFSFALTHNGCAITILYSAPQHREPKRSYREALLLRAIGGTFLFSRYRVVSQRLRALDGMRAQRSQRPVPPGRYSRCTTGDGTLG